MRIAIILVLLLCCSTFVVAEENETVFSTAFPELNTLNTIDYREGQTIELSTKVLLGSESIQDVTCGVSVVANYDNLTRLNYVQMSYDDIDQKYVYEWMPTLSWWENVQQVWNPSIGEYTAFMNCSGGRVLNESILNDVVLIRVVV